MVRLLDREINGELRWIEIWYHDQIGSVMFYFGFKSNFFEFKLVSQNKIIYRLETAA